MAEVEKVETSIPGAEELRRAKRELRRKVTQMHIARVCGIDQGSVSRILNADTRDSFAKDTVEKVFKAARELGYLHPTLVTSNRRVSPRKSITLTSDIRILRPDGTEIGAGTAEVAEVSASGIVLWHFEMNPAQLPLTLFVMEVRVSSSKLKGFVARCGIARFLDRGGELAIALRYMDLDEGNQKKLNAYVGR